VAHSKQDWAKVRAAYRRGEGNYRELGEKYGIPEQTIRKRAAREKWRDQRNETTSRAEQKAVERDVESLAERIAAHRTFARAVLEKCNGTLAAVDTFDPDGIAQVATAGAKAIGLERVALGLPGNEPVEQPGTKPRIRLIVETSDGQRVEAGDEEQGGTEAAP
jgi:hypothetical protein